MWGGSSCAGRLGNSIRCLPKCRVETGGETAWRYQRWGNLTGSQRRTERCLMFLPREVLKVSPCREGTSDLGSLEHLLCLQGFRGGWSRSRLSHCGVKAAHILDKWTVCPGLESGEVNNHPHWSSRQVFSKCVVFFLPNFKTIWSPFHENKVKQKTFCDNTR